MPGADAFAAEAALLAGALREAGQLATGMFGAGVKSWIKDVSSPVSDADIEGLATEASEYAVRVQAQNECADVLEKLDVARMRLSALAEGVDLGGLYVLAGQLAEQGVR